MSDDTVKLYNLHEGLTGRDGGPYLDQEERRLAEILRARVEKREPDFDNAPATAGTPLVTGADLVATANPASNPSQLNADPVTIAVEALAKEDDFPVSVFSERDKTDAEKQAAKDAANPYNSASSTVVGQDKEEDVPKHVGTESQPEKARKTAAKRTTKSATPKKAPSQVTKKAATAKTSDPKASPGTPTK